MCRKISKNTVYEIGMSIVFEPIPEFFFGYSLGGYPHRERCRAPDRKKSTERRGEVKIDNKKPVDGCVV
jgi:hypothetical protein